MIWSYLKTRVVFLIIGFVLGLSTSFFFRGCVNDDIKTEIVAQPKGLKKQADNNEDNYEKKIVEIEKKNSSLEHELIAIKRLLQIYKNSSKEKEAKIKKLVERDDDSGRELLNKVRPGNLVTESSLSPCDSLIEQVGQFVNESIQKDSLYEEHINIQDSIIEKKDFIISLNYGKYTELKRLFNQSLIQQERLIIDNNLLGRKIKRQKFGNKLTVIAGMIISGLTVNYLIQH